MRCRHRAAIFYAATRGRPPSRSVTVVSAAVRTISAAGEGAYTSAPTRTRRRSRRSRVAVYSCLSRWGFSPSFAHMPRRMSHAACHTQGVTRRVSHAACHTQHVTRRMSPTMSHTMCPRDFLEISKRFTSDSRQTHRRYLGASVRCSPSSRRRRNSPMTVGLLSMLRKMKTLARATTLMPHTHTPIVLICSRSAHPYVVPTLT